APLGLAGKAAGDRRHVDARAEALLRDAEGLVEPAEQGATGRPRERPADASLARARCLAHEHHRTEHGRAVHHRADHPLAGATALELAMVRFEEREAFLPGRHAPS